MRFFEREMVLTKEVAESKADNQGKRENQARSQETVNLSHDLLKGMILLLNFFRENLEVLDVSVNFPPFNHMEALIQLLAAKVYEISNQSSVSNTFLSLISANRTWCPAHLG